MSFNHATTIMIADKVGLPKTTVALALHEISDDLSDAIERPHAALPGSLSFTVFAGRPPRPRSNSTTAHGLQPQARISSVFSEERRGYLSPIGSRGPSSPVTWGFAELFKVNRARA